jgi:hypothetical protein
MPQSLQKVLFYLFLINGVFWKFLLDLTENPNRGVTLQTIERWIH